MDRYPREFTWPECGIECRHMALTGDDGFYRRRCKACVLTSLALSLMSNFAAAFDYQFGALTNSKNEFMEAYMGLMYAATHLA